MKSKLIKRLFSIILVMVTILSSSSLLFACTITEYVGKCRIVFIAKELDESGKESRKRINALAGCFDTVSERVLSNLIDYYGPISTPVSTKTIVNLNPKYDENMVSFQAVLSLMTHALWKKYNFGADREVVVLALSNYPLYSGSTQDRVNIKDLFDIDGNGELVLNEDEYYINGSNPFYQIDGSSSNWGEVMHVPYYDGTIQLFDNSGIWQGSHVFLHQHSVINNTLGYYTIDENRPKDKIEIFFVGKPGDKISGSTYSFDTLLSAKEMINALYDNSTCNAVYMDHREVQNLYSESPVELGFVNHNDSIKIWNSPLTVNGTKDPQPLFLLDNSSTDKNPLFDSEEAKTRYISLYKDKLITYYMKECFFGPDGEENSMFDSLGTVRVYIDKNNKTNEEINSVIKDLSFAELYSKIFDSTQTIANGAELDFYENYDLFISTALYNVYTLSDLHEFENNLESIVRNKIIGIEDEPLIDEDYGPFHRAYDKYVTTFIVDSSTFDDITIPSYTKSYKPSVSKVYCASEGDCPSGYTASNYAINRVDMSDNIYLKGKSLNSVIIYGCPSKQMAEGDDAFEGDAEARNEFKKEYNSNLGDFDGTFDFSKIVLFAYVSSDKELQESYPVIMRVYLHDSSGARETVRTINMVRQGSSNRYMLEYSYNGNLGVAKHYVPMSQHYAGANYVGGLGEIPSKLSNDARAKSYLLDLSYNARLSQYGSGFYYKGIADKNFLEHIMEFIFPSSADTGELNVTLHYLIVT